MSKRSASEPTATLAGKSSTTNATVKQQDKPSIIVSDSTDAKGDAHAPNASVADTHAPPHRTSQHQQVKKFKERFVHFFKDNVGGAVHHSLQRVAALSKTLATKPEAHHGQKAEKKKVPTLHPLATTYHEPRLHVLMYFQSIHYPKELHPVRFGDALEEVELYFSLYDAEGDALITEEYCVSCFPEGGTGSISRSLFRDIPLEFQHKRLYIICRAVKLVETNDKLRLRRFWGVGIHELVGLDTSTVTTPLDIRLSFYRLPDEEADDRDESEDEDETATKPTVPSGPTTHEPETDDAVEDGQCDFLAIAEFLIRREKRKIKHAAKREASHRHSRQHSREPSHTSSAAVIEEKEKEEEEEEEDMQLLDCEVSCQIFLHVLSNEAVLKYGPGGTETDVVITPALAARNEHFEADPFADNRIFLELREGQFPDAVRADLEVMVCNSLGIEYRCVFHPKRASSIPLGPTNSSVPSSGVSTATSMSTASKSRYETYTTTCYEHATTRPSWHESTRLDLPSAASLLVEDALLYVRIRHHILPPTVAKARERRERERLKERDQWRGGAANDTAERKQPSPRRHIDTKPPVFQYGFAFLELVDKRGVPVADGLKSLTVYRYVDTSTPSWPLSYNQLRSRLVATTATVTIATTFRSRTLDVPLVPGGTASQLIGLRDDMHAMFCRANGLPVPVTADAVSTVDTANTAKTRPQSEQWLCDVAFAVSPAGTNNKPPVAMTTAATVVHAHKSLLMARLPQYFEHLLNPAGAHRVRTYRPVPTEMQVPIADLSFVAFRDLIEILYGGELRDENPPQTHELIAFAERHGLENLAKLLRSYVATALPTPACPQPNVPAATIAAAARWREFHASLLSFDMHTMLDAQMYCDVAFRTSDDRIVPAHRFVLMARSEGFRTMFEVDSDGAARTGLVDLKASPLPAPHGVDAETLNAFLEYVYTAHCVPTLSNCVELLMLGHEFGFEGLKGLCAVFIAEHMDEDNVCTMLELSEINSCPRLKALCLRYIRRICAGPMQTVPHTAVGASETSAVSERVLDVETLKDYSTLSPELKKKISHVLQRPASSAHTFGRILLHLFQPMLWLPLPNKAETILSRHKSTRA